MCKKSGLEFFDTFVKREVIDPREILKWSKKDRLIVVVQLKSILFCDESTGINLGKSDTQKTSGRH